jgi:hypothetical protein
MPVGVAAFFFWAVAPKLRRMKTERTVAFKYMFALLD